MLTIRFYLLFASYVCVAFSTFYFTNQHAEVKALKLANVQLNLINSQLKEEVAEKNYAINLANTINQSNADKLEASKSELDYANSIVKKYQIQLNTTCNPATAELRIFQLTNTINKLPDITSFAQLNSQKDSAASNTGVIQYCLAVREWGLECMNQCNLGIDWYNDMSNKYNKAITK